MSYLYGDQFIWALVFFGAGIWAAMKFSGGKASWTAIVVGAFMLAIFTTDLPFVLASDAVMGLAVLGLVAVGAQYLYGVSLVQSVSIVLIAWVIGTTLMHGMM